MEEFGLRRTQSLKSLSQAQERSWVMPAPTCWNRKSVSQLVQQYQSCADLRSVEKEDHEPQVSEKGENGRWGRLGEKVSPLGSGLSSALSRSRSMDFLPQRESSGTRALCALFESKAKLKQGFHSSPRLDLCSGNKARRDSPLVDWKSHNFATGTLEHTVKGKSQGERGTAKNGFQESDNKTSRYSRGDKTTLTQNKGVSPTRPDGDRISTSSSVKERSELYLSRATAIDSTRGSTQPDLISTPATRPARQQRMKFQSPAKEMCSACLTPVYPMEKMVANKLILHNTCFCCKHCQKKLTIHNFVSLYGEFYCICHYQQLFKRKGNYDEGFGHKQHKDLWLQKNKGTDEPDALPASKFAANKKHTFGDSLDSQEREQRPKSGSDFKGKLKLSWPPEKKIKDIDPVQRTNTPNLKIKTLDHAPADIKNTRSAESQKSDKNQVKMKLTGEIKDKGLRDKSKTTGFNLAALPSEEPHPRSNPTKAINTRDWFSHSTQKGYLVTEQKNMAPTAKASYSPTVNTLDKAKKAVRFSPNVDVTQYDQIPCESRDKKKECLDKSKQSELIESTAINAQKRWTSESSKKQSEREVDIEISEDNLHEVKTNTTNLHVEPESRPTSQQNNTIEDSQDSQSLTETVQSIQGIMTLEKPFNQVDGFQSSVNPCESQLPSSLHNSAEEASHEHNNNPSGKTDSPKAEGNEDLQQNSDEKTDSLKCSAKQAEKIIAKRGSWHKGKNPLSKLLMSGGSGKTNKDARKPDIKPNGGLFGRLFQPPSEKTDGITNFAARGEAQNKTNADVKKSGKVKEAVTEEFPKDTDLLEVQLLEQESNAPEPNTLDVNKGEDIGSFTETTNLDIPSVCQGAEENTAHQALEPNIDQQSDLQSSESEALTVTDPSTAESINLATPVTPMNKLPQVSVLQSTGEKIGEKVQSDEVNNDVIEDSVTSFPADQLMAPREAHCTVQKTNDLFDKNQVGGRNLGEAFSDHSHEQQHGSGSVFDPSEHQEMSVNDMSDTYSSTVSDMPLSAGGSECIGLLDSQPLSSESEVMLSMTDKLIVTTNPAHKEHKTTDLFITSQTSEKGTELDIFKLNSDLFNQPPAVNTSDGDAPTTQPSTFSDIFGVSDLSESPAAFSVLPGSQATLNSFEEARDSNAANSKEMYLPKQPVEKADSLMCSAKEAEGVIDKPGLCSKTNNPLTKFLTSGGSGKTNKDDKKPDNKTNGGLLGRLLQPSSDKTAAITKCAAQGEKQNTTNADFQKSSAEKEAITKDLQKNTDLHEVQLREQKCMNSNAPELNTLDVNKEEDIGSFTETIDLDIPSVGQTAEDSTDPEPMAESANLSAPVTPMNQLPQVSISQSTGYNIGAKAQSDEVNNDIIKDSVTSLSADQLMGQTEVDGSVQKTNDLFDTNHEGGRNLGEEFLDHSHEQQHGSGSVFGPSEHQDMSVNNMSDTYSSTVSGMPLSAGGSEYFGLLDSQPIASENEVIVTTNPAHNERQASDPFITSQTSEQGTELDIFNLNHDLFNQPLNVSDQDAPTSQSSTFSDIFGVSDLSESTDLCAVLTSNPAASNTFGEVFGSDEFFTGPPSAQLDPFAVDIFTSGTKALPVSEASDADSLMDSFFVSENKNVGQTAGNSATSSNWMDDLLG